MKNSSLNIVPTSAKPADNSLRKAFSFREFKDLMWKQIVGIGGGAVLFSLLLIFIYLAYVVVPLFAPASLHQQASYQLPADSQGKTLLLSIEEQNELALRVTNNGDAIFFRTKNGEIIDQSQILQVPEVEITAIATQAPGSDFIVLGLSNGQVQIAQHKYKLTYPDNQRVVLPELIFPLGEEPLTIFSESGVHQLSFAQNADRALIAATSLDNHLVLAQLEKEVSFLDDSVSVNATIIPVPFAGKIQSIFLDNAMSLLVVVTNQAEAHLFDIRNLENITTVNVNRLSDDPEQILAIQWLAGTRSLLVEKANGTVEQWFPTRDQTTNQKKLSYVRKFEVSAKELGLLIPEHARKGFATFDAQGRLSIHHATSSRKLVENSAFAGKPIVEAALSPRANSIIAEDTDGTVHFWKIENEHPEISWSSLWAKIWYEGYSEPEFIWQSSSASNDFEPKFSLSPLAFGTLKAAFYAMLFAIPLGVLGAAFTAYFMSPGMRKIVKPTVEIMEALPTVILGFLAGLWLAPFMEANLPGMFALFIVLPPTIVLASLLWRLLPKSVRTSVPEGWEAALLVPVILITVYGVLQLGPVLELYLMDGNARQWITNDLGIDFDQRNALVVGIAMGFAVIPTIFSITEDAIFSVPRHLTMGSLALGATPWQSLVRVVLLTASPGIFSAIMIGFGRAIGETMIVLMATGNTPVMDMSWFQGMRTLSANIAVEMPESEVGSTHYRILFLAALVLFVFTFLFNTIAEVVRQRLRKRYGSL